MREYNSGVNYTGFSVTHRVFLCKKIIGYYIECTDNEELSGIYLKEDVERVLLLIDSTLRGRCFRLKTLSLRERDGAYISPKNQDTLSIYTDNENYFDYKTIIRPIEGLIGYIEKKRA